MKVYDKICDLYFLLDLNPPGSLIKRLQKNIFELCVDFAEIFDFFKTPRCASHHGARLCCVSQALWCASHHKVRLCVYTVLWSLTPLCASHR